jgi:hypothetical protein
MAITLLACNKKSGDEANGGEKTVTVTIMDLDNLKIDLYKATNIKEVSMDGGWALTYENKGSAGTKNYWFLMRKEVGRKEYLCKSSVAHKTLRDGALRACKTLRN